MAVTSTLDPSQSPLTSEAPKDNYEFNVLDSQDSPLAEDDDLTDMDHYENLVGYLEEKLVRKIGQSCLNNFAKDMESRTEWEDTIRKGNESLGIKLEELNEPFEGACSTTHPLILEAAVKFQSKATTELLPAEGPVKTQVIGKQTEDKLQRASRVKDFMNFQITKQMPEYYPDMEKLLFYLPLYGSCFKKTYWDSVADRPVSCCVTSDNFVINNSAKSLEKARRYTEILPPVSGQELFRKIIAGEYIEPKAWRQNSGRDMGQIVDGQDVHGDFQVGGDGTFFNTTVDQGIQEQTGLRYVDGQYGKIFTLCEQHVYLTLPEPYGSGYIADPYIVVFDKDSGEVLKICRNWKEGDVNRKKRIWYTHYLYVPGFGFYGLGLYHLLGNFQLTLTTIIRSLVDSGQFANLQGGIKLKGLRILGDGGAVAPGEWKEAESAIQDISKALFPFPYKEPSQTLFALLQWLDQRAGSFADSTEQVVGDSTNYGPVGTTVALLEASMKLFSAIHKRTHYSQENDLKLLAELDYEYLPSEYPYEVPGEEKSIFKQDFDPKVVDVIPVSSPNITSAAHRINLAQTKLQAALQAPQIHNLKKAYRDFYYAIGTDDVDDLLPPDQTAQPLDPLGDIQAIVMGHPIKAFPGQDHENHVKFKLSWLSDPVVGGKSMTMQQFVPLVLANIREHQLAKFQEQIQGLTQGQTDPKVLAQVQAQAAQEVIKANQALASITNGDDPMHMIAQAEVMKAQTEAERVKHVKVKDLADLSLKAQELDIKRVNAAIKGKEVGADAQLSQFQAAVNAVQQGIQNLLKETEIGDKKEIEFAKIKAIKDKPRGT